MLVAGWRELRSGDREAVSGVERARVEERRWELEVPMISEFGLTLGGRNTFASAGRRSKGRGVSARGGGGDVGSGAS